MALAIHPQCQNGVVAGSAASGRRICQPPPSKLTTYFPIPSVCGLQRSMNLLLGILREMMKILQEDPASHR
jgi:hypothetical protein